MACRMIQSSDWDAGAKRGSTQESLTTRDMANLQNVNGGRHPGRASPPGDGKQRNKVHPPPRSGDRSQPGCESERVAVSAASSAVALKTEGYLGMSPPTPAGISGVGVGGTLGAGGKSVVWGTSGSEGGAKGGGRI